MDASSFVELKPNPNIPDFRPGDGVRVHAKVVEGDRERIQMFEGVVIRIRRGGINSTFTVRRVSHGVGIERVFPYHSPLVDKVEVVRVGRVRRAKLYYLRDRVGKAARIKPGARARFEALTAGRGVPMAEQPEEEEEEEQEDVMAEVSEEGEAGAEAEAGEALEAEGEVVTEEVAEPEPEAGEPEEAAAEAAPEGEGEPKD